MATSLIYSNRGMTSTAEVENEMKTSENTVILLDLTDNYLKDFNTKAKFIALNILVLDNNMICSIDNFPTITSLEHLSINNNSLSGLTAFSSTCQLKYPNIKKINTLRNPMNPSFEHMNDYEGYRNILKSRIKTLEELDGIKMNDAKFMNKQKQTEPVFSKPQSSAKSGSLTNFFNTNTSTPTTNDKPLQKQQETMNKPPKKVMMFAVDEKDEIDGTEYVNTHKKPATIMYSEKILKKSDNLTKFNRKNHSEGNKHILNNDL